MDLDTLVASLANHLTSENDMRIRYKRKKNEIELAFNKSVTDLQAQKLPPKRTRTTDSNVNSIDIRLFFRI